MSKNNDYITSNLMDDSCFSKHYKLIAIDLRKQRKLENLNLIYNNKLISLVHLKNMKQHFFPLLRNQKKQLSII